MSASPVLPSLILARTTGSTRDGAASEAARRLSACGIPEPGDRRLVVPCWGAGRGPAGLQALVREPFIVRREVAAMEHRANDGVRRDCRVVNKGPGPLFNLAA